MEWIACRVRRVAAMCGIALMACVGGADAQGTAWELPVREQVLPTDGVPVDFGDRSGDEVSERGGRYRLSAELLIPQYSDFPDPEAIVRKAAGEESGNEDVASASEAPPVRWDAELLSFVGGFSEGGDGKAGRDLGGIGSLEPGEEMWALCFAVATRVSGNCREGLDAIDGEGDAANVPTIEFWQGELNFNVDAPTGMASAAAPGSAVPLARLADARPVHATATCALVALLGIGWLIHRSRQRVPTMPEADRAPGDEW